MKNKKFEINRFPTPSQDLNPVKTETENKDSSPETVKPASEEGDQETDRVA